MLNNEEIITLEKKYFYILRNTLVSNLGKIISQICSQKLFEDLTENEKNNVIDSAVENIIEGIISRNLDWNTCSMPVRSDSCYECGDAIIHIDAKTIKIDDGDSISNKINVEKSQTTYDYNQDLTISNKIWKPYLRYYENHNYYGKIHNLTYFVRVIYSEQNLVENISLISIPHGQLFSIFGKDILNAGKLIEYSDHNKRKNIRFSINKIIETEGQEWRNEILYKRR